MRIPVAQHPLPHPLHRLSRNGGFTWVISNPFSFLEWQSACGLISAENGTGGKANKTFTCAILRNYWTDPPRPLPNPLRNPLTQIALNQKLYFAQIKREEHAVAAQEVAWRWPCGHKSHLVKYWITPDMGRDVSRERVLFRTPSIRRSNLVGQKDDVLPPFC